MAFRDAVGLVSVLLLVVFAMVTTILAISRELDAKNKLLASSGGGGNVMTSSPPALTPR